MKISFIIAIVVLVTAVSPCVWSANAVYANGHEVSYRGAEGVQIVFPDTADHRPQSPATPPGVPIPYPAFGTGQGEEECDEPGPQIETLPRRYSQIPVEERLPGEIRGPNGTYFAPFPIEVRIGGENTLRDLDLGRPDHR